MEIKEIKEDELHNLYQTQNAFGSYKPLGLFWLQDKDTGLYIGIDNSNGDAWTEEFKTKEDCIKWLNGWEGGDEEITCPVCGTYYIKQLKSEFFKCTNCKCKWDEDARREHED